MSFDGRGTGYRGDDIMHQVSKYKSIPHLIGTILILSHLV